MLLSFTLFSVILVLYTVTLYPSVPGGDSGEMIAVAYDGGIAHPPGYPLFTLLGHLFIRLIPWGEVAWRCNLLSAFCGAFTALSLYHTSLRILELRAESAMGAGMGEFERKVASLIGAASFALNPLIWLYSTQAEVFALNNLLCALLLHITVCSWTCRRYLTLGAFMCGCCMCNQHTSALFILPCISGMLVRYRSLLFSPTLGSLRQWFLLIVAGLLGLLPYAFLPIVANWRELDIFWGNFTTLEGIMHHVLRRDYGTLVLGADAALDTWELKFFRYRLFLSRVGIIQCACFLYACYQSWRMPQGGGILRLMLLTGAFYVLVFFYLAEIPNLDTDMIQGVIARFFMQPLLVVALSVAVVTVQWIPRHHKVITTLVLLLIASGMVMNQWSVVDNSQNRIVANYGRDLLQSTPPDGILLTKGDLSFNPVRYWQFCMNIRPDVIVLDQEMMGYDWNIDYLRQKYPASRTGLQFPGKWYRLKEDGFSMDQFLNGVIDERAVMVAEGFKELDYTMGEGPDARYLMWPVGITQRVLRRTSNVDFDVYKNISLQHWPWQPTHAEYYALPVDAWERTVLRRYWYITHLIGTAASLYGIQHRYAPAFAWCESIYTDLLLQDPEPQAYYFKNLGICQASLGQQHLVAFREYLRTSLGKEDPQRDVIRGMA